MLKQENLVYERVILIFTITMAKNPNHLSEKQLATHNRQKAINLLEKITKNMFRMFRKSETTTSQITERFFHLKKQLDALGNITINTEYHREMRVYVEYLSSLLSSDFDLESIRSDQMSRLNRIQKVKNKTSYRRKEKYSKKEKHIDLSTM